MFRSRTVRLAVAAAVAGGGAVVALPSPASAATAATLVAMHSTSSWAVPSPDPAGITYDPVNRRLVISDCEVDEMPLYKGRNIFFASLKGVQTSTNVGWTTEPWSYEPTGINRVSSSLTLISDDDMDRVFLVSTGSNGKPTATPRSFTLRPTNGDAEDVTAVGGAAGHIFTVDGVGKTVYDYGRGPNGRFDGVPPAGDDTRVAINVGQYGAGNPEGIAYYPARNAILVLDSPSKTVYELTRSGALINKISIAAAGPRHAAGIALAPASNGSGRTNMYIVDRGVDNNTNAAENDGRLYEMSATL
jgi:hypothetical protein